jgi:hypothetical protein
MKAVSSALGLLVGLVFATACGCHAALPVPAASAGPPTDPEPVRLEYADTDAFDVLFEAALRNTPGVIIVQTDHAKPDWGPRLNAWIAAWNQSGRAEGRKVRGQIPSLPEVVVDGDSIREFRLLIDDLMGRAEESARAGAQWWVEQRLRERRVALLRPYGLRFQLDDDGHIQLIFSRGRPPG